MIKQKKATSIQYQPAGQFEDTRFEKIHNVVFSSSDEASICVAEEISGASSTKQ